MERNAQREKLTGSKRDKVYTAANYLLKLKNHLRYDEYLAAGPPIATGVIEGACRYLVKDRMEITGARWRLKIAEAILKLRSLRAKAEILKHIGRFTRKKSMGVTTHLIVMITLYMRRHDIRWCRFKGTAPNHVRAICDYL